VLSEYLVFSIYIYQQGCRPWGVLARWHPQIFADQLTLSQPREADFSPLKNTGTPGFSDLPTALQYVLTM
jgi:hypothetical protein